MPAPRTPVVLIVRDGWGRNPNPEHDAFNAVKLARTPRCDELLRRYPWTLIHTSGEHVGLPEGTMGNSEVGHQNLGAGRIIFQDSVRISRDIREGSFFSNDVLAEAVNRARKNGKYVHLLGIASDAGVHGLLTHLYACLDLCKRLGHAKVALHLFTDGRDTGPFTGLVFVKQIEAKCGEVGVGAIASIAGRYYAMDRDFRWERVEKAYRVLTGFGAADEHPYWAPSALEALQRYYDHPTSESQKGDEFITPTMIGASPREAMQMRISEGDSVVFYNYRGDRPRELTRAFVMPEFYGHVKPSPDTGTRGFDRGPQLDLYYVTLTEYDQTLADLVHVAFPKPPKTTDVAGDYLARKGKRQFRCAETEKFPHVTFFFNDYREEPFKGEARQMAQSPKVATYDLKPEMSAPEVTQIMLRRLDARDCEDFILVNYANGDMVGHTGNLRAAIKAIETVDEAVGRLADATLARGGALIITADHGNAEQMWDPANNSPHTAHTIYDVECIVVDPRHESLASGSPERPSERLRGDSRLADVLPTALDLMGMPKPEAMTGVSLFK